MSSPDVCWRRAIVVVIIELACCLQVAPSTDGAQQVEGAGGGPSVWFEEKLCSVAPNPETLLPFPYFSRHAFVLIIVSRTDGVFDCV